MNKDYEKRIGEQIRLLEEKGEAERFVLGYEESYGYLTGSFVRDKDAVIASMLIVEMASYYKKEGKTLLDVYADIEKEFGIYHHGVDSFKFGGAKGLKKMQSIMQALRDNAPSEIAGLKVMSVLDYQARIKTKLESGEQSDIDLPAANVLEFRLENNCKLMVRPSGTEPKIKFYYTAVSDSKQSAEKLCAELADFAKKTVE